MEVALNYKLYDDQANIKNEGEAKATFDDRYLTLIVMFGEPMLFAYTDIVGISDYDYKVDLFLNSKEKLNLSGLGYQYEDFLFQLYKLRNDLLLKFLLIDESLLKDGFEAKYSQLDPNGQTSQTGNCEIRLYDTAIVVLPQKSEPIRLPYCYMTNVNKQDYTLKITNEFLEKIEFTQLGQNFDPLAKALSDALNKMILRTQENIKELIPEATPLAINKIASLMKDGLTAKRKEIELQSQDFWGRLEKKIDEAGITKEYEFLNSSAPKDRVCVGIKRGLMGDLTGTYIWMMFPLLNPGTNRLSNTIAIEAFNTQDNTGENSKQQGISEDTVSETEKETSQNPDEEQKPATIGATYFFRTMERKEYAQTKNEDLTNELENFTKNINRAMIDVNFRREPIFLSEEQLNSTKYVQYRFAIARMPSLRILRSLFIGRVIHSSPKQWKSDVASLLAFNTKSLDDKEKWKKGDA
ncbi:MAG TPA: hypothetical protein VK253_03670 [Candidatus Binatia bacterium]|nr:hypothetical protein [Candidatus Binatia bacterium]